MIAVIGAGKMGEALISGLLKAGTSPDDVLITEVMQKMVKQRRESIEMFEAVGGIELAAGERAELAVIESFMPAQMDESAAKAAIGSIVAELGASSVKDMGRLMAAVKARHSGAIDMARASGLVKAALTA